jgi:hypothetical protein
VQLSVTFLRVLVRVLISMEALDFLLLLRLDEWHQVYRSNMRTKIRQ